MTDDEILKAFKSKCKDNLRKAIIRPKFRLHKELLQIVLFVAVIISAIFICSELSTWLYIAIISALILLFLITQTKNILFFMIFLYQKFAPRVIRAACLYTPSCSEYMRISIEKYGVFKGVKKGFGRLRRCRPPNGGFDEP